jgi:hypothetical protein
MTFKGQEQEWLQVMTKNKIDRVSFYDRGLADKYQGIAATCTCANTIQYHSNSNANPNSNTKPNECLIHVALHRVR